MLQFLYTGAYDLSDDKQPLLAHTKVYVLGHLYDIPYIRDLALRTFSQHLSNGCDYDDFLCSLAYMFSKLPHADRSLKNVAIEFAATNTSELSKQPASKPYLPRMKQRLAWLFSGRSRFHLPSERQDLVLLKCSEQIRCSSLGPAEALDAMTHFPDLTSNSLEIKIEISYGTRSGLCGA